MGCASIRAQELLDTRRMDVTQQLQAAEKELPAHLVILGPLPARSRVPPENFQMEDNKVNRKQM